MKFTDKLQARYLAAKHSQKGATALEYALMAGAIALVIITAVVAVGGDAQGVFNGLNTGMDAIPTA